MESELLALLRRDAAADAVATRSLEDWERLVARAVETGCVALLYFRLRERAGVPEAVLDALRTHYLGGTVAAARRSRQLAGLVGTLHARGIDVVVLKGACLAETVCENPALRAMVDIDVLVRRDDLFRAREALLESGYRQYRDVPLEEELALEHHLVPLVCDERGALAVEVHWSLLPPGLGSIGMERFWERRVALRIGEAGAFALRPEDLLLHLCVHAGLQHRLRMGIQPLLDIDALLAARGVDFDWEDFAERAGEVDGAPLAAALLLSLARESLGTPVPESALRRLAPAGIPAGLPDLAVRQLARPSDPPYVSITLSRLRDARGPGAFLRILRERLFPAGDVLLKRYGAPSRALLPLIRVVHPFRLLGIHARSAVLVLLGSRSHREEDEAQRRGEEISRTLRAAGSVRRER